MPTLARQDGAHDYGTEIDSLSREGEALEAIFYGNTAVASAVICIKAKLLDTKTIGLDQSRQSHVRQGVPWVVRARTHRGATFCSSTPPSEPRQAVIMTFSAKVSAARPKVS